MKIMTLQGTDKLLYELVAPLVMNPAICDKITITLLKHLVATFGI